ncbi:hypothetical protein PAECIP111891_06875 [Paenibacillus allorhizoplanae]|uniref:Uncharacterized protein n=1 Tax=Paenibacillus allorhizoplanae TaxID=2905648 RepID=A0ABN8HAB4_9BACL|nr:hypothetical protein PAECIP111891_06875 [Paenibacillus allorhizoplanae]
MKTYSQLKTEIQTISDEISLLYKIQDELNKHLQEVCLHENKVTLDNVEYSGMLQSIDYCMDCRKPLPLASFASSV